MERIIWQKDYEVNIPLIDEQHKGLVELINQIVDAKLNNKSDEILREVIYKLVEYTKVHFSCEEEHMQKNHYPRLVFHNAQHQGLVNSVIEILNKLKAGDANVIDNIQSILSSWLIKHILEEDKKYGTFYHNKLEHKQKE